MPEPFTNDPEYDRLLREIRADELTAARETGRSLRVNARALVAESRRTRDRAQSVRARASRALHAAAFIR